MKRGLCAVWYPGAGSTRLAEVHALCLTLLARHHRRITRGIAVHSSSLVLTDEQRRQLEDLVRRPTTPQRSVWRALIVLAAADGQGYRSIAQAHGVTRNTVRKWCRRFAGRGLAGLADLARPGQPRRITAEERCLVIATAWPVIRVGAGAYWPRF